MNESNSTNRATISEVEELLRSPIEEVELVAPPASVWDAISEGIKEPAQISVAQISEEPLVDNKTFASEVTAGSSSPNIQRKEKLAKAVFAIAAAFALIAGIGYVTTRSVDQTSAELLALGEFDGSGLATVDGGVLQLDVGSLSAPEGFNYELWLLEVDGDGEVADLESLGNIGSANSYDLPSEVNLEQFSVVDISLEPIDGDESHSGNSILRGELA